MKIIGLLLVVNSIALTAWWVTTHDAHKGSAITICLIAMFAGLCLIMQDRITELTVDGVGSVKASVEKVEADAKTVADLKTRVETQSATVDLVASEASKAKALSEETAEKNKQAEKQMETITETLTKAQDSLDELESITEFTTTVVAAQSDDREAFDQLDKWAQDKSFRFAAKARQAWNKIRDEHSKSMYSSGFPTPWAEGFDASKLKLPQLAQQYAQCPANIKPWMLEYIWKRNDIPERDRLSFMIDVMKTDKSLKAVEYAGRHFTGGTKQKIKPVAVDYLVKWWADNKDSYDK